MTEDKKKKGTSVDAEKASAKEDVRKNVLVSETVVSSTKVFSTRKGLVSGSGVLQARKEIDKTNRESEDYLKKARERAKKNRRKLKLLVLSHYGTNPPRCTCPNCYYHNHDCPIEFLSIDHIHGGGINHRKRVGTGNYFYFWLRKNNFPEGYQVLCHNCNQGRQLNDGICPHKESIVVE